MSVLSHQLVCSVVHVFPGSVPLSVTSVTCVRSKTPTGSTPMLFGKSRHPWWRIHVCISQFMGVLVIADLHSSCKTITSGLPLYTSFVLSLVMVWFPIGLVDSVCHLDIAPGSTSTRSLVPRIPKPNRIPREVVEHPATRDVLGRGPPVVDT